MTYFPDLSPCAYFDRSAEARAWRPIAVGWLDDALPTPPCDPKALGRVVDALVRIWDAHVDPWPVAMGRHGCRLCGMPPDRAPATEEIHNGIKLRLGSGYITVPAPGVLYVAPSLIIHYILAHGYQPPAAFCHAVEQCPNPRSRAYERAVQREARSLLERHDPGVSAWRRWLIRHLPLQSLQKTAVGRRLRRLLVGF